MDEFIFTPGKKSSFHAKKHFKAGENLIARKKYFEAVENFNKSMCHAQKDSDEYRNILARRDELYNLVDTNKLNEDLWSFFKLSHPPCSKNPDLIECLKLRNDDHFGRYVYTIKDLMPGDIIAIEEPLFKFVDPSAHHLRCSNCLRSNKLRLMASELCSSSMFCSKNCESYANEVYHKLEVNLRTMEFIQKILLESVYICDGSYEKLREIVCSEELQSKTVFDFDWCKQKKESGKLMDKFISFNALQVGPDSFEHDWLDSHPILETLSEEHKCIAKMFMRRVSRILSVNCYALDWITPEVESDNSYANSSSQRMKIGSGIFILGSLFNHSCAPNIDRILVDNKFVFFVRRPIMAGDQLFISYGPSFARHPNENRQEELIKSFHFKCCCEACEKNYPIDFIQSMVRSKKIFSSETENSSMQCWISEFLHNCSIINKHFKTFPNKSMCNLMDRNSILLAGIAKNEPYIFE